MSSIWDNPKNIEFLKRAWADGESGSVIGLKMGISRNAVIGKIHRLGMAKRKTKEIGAHRTRPRSYKITPEAAAAKEAIAMEAKSVMTVLHIDEPEDGLEGVSLLNLKPHHCRFPMWPHLRSGSTFCGKKKKSGSSYCEEHARICRGILVKRKVGVVNA